MITTDMIKEVRVRSGAGVLDCRNALKENNGDVDKAIDHLRKKGLASASKKAGRLASEGLVSSYIHGNGKVGVLVEINCETDFVAKTDNFKALARDIAMQIAASKPEYVCREEVPAELIQKEKDILMAQIENEGKKKPANIVEKIVEGRINKFFKSVCLLEQPFIKDDEKTVEQLLKESIATTGENIKIRRFVRFEMGEGLAKKANDFADEVAQMVK
ncbi:translation elongation factor Ts [Clostridium sp. 'deep sea']|uniref:translation elongation factor Ts n=1 Tax=Clostridium sp. 'deep sea' TaxID=2779445 RepID=UPI00243433D0|nr:translation elongation factor Ts [Clostridium sp. 'deep sea']